MTMAEVDVYSTVMVAVVEWGGETLGTCERCQQEARNVYRQYQDPVSYAGLLFGARLDDVLPTWRKLCERERKMHKRGARDGLPAKLVCTNCAVDLLLEAVAENSLQHWADVFKTARPGEETASGLTIGLQGAIYHDFLRKNVDRKKYPNLDVMYSIESWPSIL
jgi:hypothetical protein